jgi:hypothetical protein
MFEKSHQLDNRSHDKKITTNTENISMDVTNYPKRILLAVTGLSPQVVTETLYALDHSRKPLDTAQASVTLAAIPFVRLRHGLPDLILQGKSSFSEAVNKAQQKLWPPSLKINLELQQIQLAGLILHLPPANLAFYSWFARRKLNLKTALKWPSEGAPEPDYGKDYLAEYQKINSPVAAMERTETTLAKGMDKNFFEHVNPDYTSGLKQDWA